MKRTLRRQNWTGWVTVTHSGHNYSKGFTFNHVKLYHSFTLSLLHVGVEVETGNIFAAHSFDLSRATVTLVVDCLVLAVLEDEESFLALYV